MVFTTEEQRSVILSVSKRAQCKNIHTEIIPAYGGKCLPHKAAYKWPDKLSQGRSKVADDARPGAEVAETIAKRLLSYW
jgi:hypothetical protein